MAGWLFLVGFSGLNGPVATSDSWTSISNPKFRLEVSSELVKSASDLNDIISVNTK